MSYGKLEPILKDRGCEYTEGYEGEPNIFSPALTQRNDEPAKAADVVVDKHNFLSQRQGCMLCCALPDRDKENTKLKKLLRLQMMT